MALDFGFYDSMNGDRRYNAAQMDEIFEGVINDGVYASVGDKFFTTAGTGMQVLVGTGRAWFKNTWNRNKAVLPLDIPQADPAFDRIDSVVLEVNKEDAVRENRIFIMKGNVAVNPEPPIFPTTAAQIYYMRLANVRVRALTESITASDITITVGSSETPFVTSVLQQTDIDELFANWTDQFMTWWNDLKTLLSDDVVGNIINRLDNLQGQIDDITTGYVKISDKATASNISSGTADKWVDAAELKTRLATTETLITNRDPKVGEIRDTANSTFSYPVGTWVKASEQVLKLGDTTYSLLQSMVAPTVFSRTDISAQIQLGTVQTTGWSVVDRLFFSNGASVVVYQTGYGGPLEITRQSMAFYISADGETVVSVMSATSRSGTSMSRGLNWGFPTIRLAIVGSYIVACGASSSTNTATVSARTVSSSGTLSSSVQVSAVTIHGSTAGPGVICVGGCAAKNSTNTAYFYFVSGTDGTSSGYDFLVKVTLSGSTPTISMQKASTSRSSINAGSIFYKGYQLYANYAYLLPNVSTGGTTVAAGTIDAILGGSGPMNTSASSSTQVNNAEMSSYTTTIVMEDLGTIVTISKIYSEVSSGGAPTSTTSIVHNLIDVQIAKEVTSTSLTWPHFATIKLRLEMTDVWNIAANSSSASAGYMKACRVGNNVYLLYTALNSQTSYSHTLIRVPTFEEAACGIGLQKREGLGSSYGDQDMAEILLRSGYLYGRPTPHYLGPAMTGIYVSNSTNTSATMHKALYYIPPYVPHSYIRRA